MAGAFQSSAFQNNAFQTSGTTPVVPPVVVSTPAPGGVGGRRSWAKNYTSTFEHYRKKLKKEQEEAHGEELQRLADIAEQLSKQQAKREETYLPASDAGEFYRRFEQQLEQFVAYANRERERKALEKLIADAQEAARIEAELQDDEEAAAILLLN